MSNWWLILAQTTQPAGGAGGAPAAFDPGSLICIGLALLVFYWFLFRGQRKERQKHAEMLTNLKRNDRVQTIGGILGTVVDVRDHEVVLKVDETNNVKMRFNRSAVKEVLTAEPPDKK
ncbi:MAG: preprotein translocase subunit YajC [Planctomycetota bacterium]|nr:MAG: preprotein translocase subunit YajC [Planctomycetota bacterium]